MNKLLKTLGSVLLVSAVSAVSFGQIKSLGFGKPVIGVSLDTKKFNPQINTTFRPNVVEKDHELKFNYPLGQINNLLSGGTLSEGRVNLGNNSRFPGISATSLEPPDPDLAVGPNHIVEVVNSNIAFFTKTGTKLFEQPGQQFFQSISPEAFDFDPKVIYDQIAKRFVVLDLGLKDEASTGTSSFLIAVSNTSDPTGTWKLFKVDNKQTVGANSYWLDYPGLGYNKDMICMSGNMFAMTGSSGFNGVQIMAFDKATLYGGTATPFKFNTGGFTVQLAKTLDSTSPAVYAVNTESQNSMTLTAITKSGSSFNVTQASVPVPKWDYDQGFITGPGGVQVQTNDPRQLVATSWNGRILSSHSVAVSSSDQRPGARWYDFKTNGWPVSGTPTLFQSGQVNPPTGHGYSFPAVQIDKKGGIGMTFSMIGSSTPGKVMASGRRPSDPPGTMGAPIVLENSLSGTYNGFSSRWGDYFDLELDPNDSSTFWAVGMGAGTNGRWQTFIKSFKVSLPDTDLLQVLPSGVTTVAGTLMSGNKTSLYSPDSVTLDIQSKSVSGLGQVAGFNSVYTIPFSGGVDTLRVFLKASGATGSSALVSLLNVQKGVYEQVTTFGLSPTGVSKVLELTPAQIALYVSSTKQVSMIVRGVNPTRSGAAPAVFTFKTDQGTLGAAEVVN